MTTQDVDGPGSEAELAVDLLACATGLGTRSNTKKGEPDGPLTQGCTEASASKDGRRPSRTGQNVGMSHDFTGNLKYMQFFQFGPESKAQQVLNTQESSNNEEAGRLVVRAAAS
jgi:hypothetical protein